MTCHRIDKNTIICRDNGADRPRLRRGWTLYGEFDYELLLEDVLTLCSDKERKWCEEDGRCNMDFHPLGHYYNRGAVPNPDERQRKVGLGNLRTCRKVKIDLGKVIDF